MSKTKDLFENFANLTELHPIFEGWDEGGMNYIDCQVALDKCQALGYTFEFALDAEPYNLRKMPNFPTFAKAAKQQASVDRVVANANTFKDRIMLEVRCLLNTVHPDIKEGTEDEISKKCDVAMIFAKNIVRLNDNGEGGTRAEKLCLRKMVAVIAEVTRKVAVLNRVYSATASCRVV